MAIVRCSHDNTGSSMRAAVYDRYGGPIEVLQVADPSPARDGVVVKVEASGICRSDWHAWVGHDPVSFPHVGGHECAGVVVDAGPDVRRWRAGDRVIVPFSIGCGRCAFCVDGHSNVCGAGWAPGFSGGVRSPNGWPCPMRMPISWPCRRRSVLSPPRAWDAAS
jgi:D-arabinose 1-dehydrogenase-like Zn-dependent alcohol dehydrogenase